VPLLFWEEKPVQKPRRFSAAGRHRFQKESGAKDKGADPSPEEPLLARN
jgi:hypothetical protein